MDCQEKKRNVSEKAIVNIPLLSLGIPNMIMDHCREHVGDAVYSNSSRQMCIMLVFSLLLLISILKGATKKVLMMLGARILRSRILEYCGGQI
jgi:hypothetical protein